MQSRHLTHELGLVDITGANLWTSDQSGLSTKLPDLKDQCIFLVDSRWSTNIPDRNPTSQWTLESGKRTCDVCRRHLKQRTKQQLT